MRKGVVCLHAGCVRQRLDPFVVREHSWVVLPDEQCSPEQVAVFRRMTPEQRWHSAYRLYWTCRRHKEAYVRSQHPEWPEERVEDEVRRIFANART